MSEKRKIAILGGNEKELSVIRELHGSRTISIIGIYDHNNSNPGMIIGKVVGLDTFSEKSELGRFQDAELIITDFARRDLQEEIENLAEYGIKIIDVSEAYKLLADKDNAASPEVDYDVDEIDRALSFMNRISDTGKLLEWILDISAQSLGSSQGSIMLYSESTDELYIGYATGLSKKVIDTTRLKLGEGIAGKSASIRKAILTTDIGENRKIGKDRENIVSAVTAPIVQDEKLLGVLNISTDRGEKLLDEEDRERITVIAGKIAPILSKHLQTDLDETEEIENGLNRYLEKAAAGGSDFHYRFTVISKFINDLFNASTTSIYTATDEGDWLILGGSNNLVQESGSASRIQCLKGTMARVYLNGEKLIMTEKREVEGDDEKLISIVYQPLFYNEPVGVIVIEFTYLKDQERYLKYMDRIGFRLGIFIASRLREMRQEKRIENIEKFSDLVPNLIDSGSLLENLDKLPAVLADLINASSASLHYFEKNSETVSYYNFPEEESEFNSFKIFDSATVKKILEKGKAECTSFLSDSAESLNIQPLYRSILAYPLLEHKDRKLIFAAYNKQTVSPLDPSIFGNKDIELIGKAEKILRTLYTEKRISEDIYPEEDSILNLDELLEMNQNLLINRIDEEIRRAKRYHHSFTLTTIKVVGLLELLSESRDKGLKLINQLGAGIKSMIRNTDYFSWIEQDTFTVLSIESLGRIKTLEARINSFIDDILRRNGYYDKDSFHPVSSYARYPGKSNTPAELIIESRKYFNKSS